MPMSVIWCYVSCAAIFAIGLAALFRRREWQEARGLDKLIVLGPLFYAAPLAAFGSEHFTVTAGVASLMPAWIPWHRFWVYLVGACFVAAAVSLVTRIQARLAASLLASTFFLFVALMDAPSWAQAPRDRFALALALRELSFGAGALALAVRLGDGPRDRRAHALAATARSFIGVAVLFFAVEQLLHGEYVPAIPLDRVTPTWIFGHGVWTHLTAAAYAIGGAALVAGKRARAAAAWLGATVLLVELAVYLPIAVVERASLVGFNFAADTLMFCGALLLLAGAMPRASAAAAR